jgi:small subunit ribosomal protein S1
MQPYSPEGLTAMPPSPDALHRGVGEHTIFRAMCIKCDEYHNLHVDLGTQIGIIPREETAIGISEGKTREIAIVSRVGKPVCFQVLRMQHDGTPILSRRAAQIEARSYFFSTLRPGDILPAIVQNVTDFGLFCDIGCGFTALMRIDRCCISRLATCADLFHPGQPVCAAVLAIDDCSGFIHLTGRELLGTWEENAEQFRQGQTVTGTVRSIFPYGIFVELTPNLSGLAEPASGYAPGDSVSVFLRAVLPGKHKIKLNILEKLPAPLHAAAPEYFITSGHIGKWEYFPGSRAVTYF